MDLTSLSILVAVTIGLTEVIKRAIVKDCNRFIPLIAIGLATILNIFIIRIGADIPSLILNGIIAGLSSVGLFSTTKNTIDK